MNKPQISVIMPAYNSEKFIKQAIDSILKQSFTNFELIVIDDLSEDNTRNVVKEIIKADKRVKLVVNKTKMKVTGSANKASSLAKSDIIARMDSDDISHPKRLETQFEFLKTHKEVAIVGSNIYVINEVGNRISKREYATESKKLKRIMFRYSPFAQPVIMYRKKIFEEFSGYDEKLSKCEDIDLWFKIGSKYEFANIPKYLLKYRLLENSTSHKNIKELELIGFKIKLKAVLSYGYRPGFFDLVYNLLEFISLWFMPSHVRIYFYNYLRSKKII